MIPRELVFVDVETTGVDVRYHHVWEVVILAWDGAVLLNATAWTPCEHMDPNAARVNRLFSRFPFFYVQERCDGDFTAHPRPRMFRPETSSVSRVHLAKAVAQLTAGKVLAAACVSTDATFLTKLLHEFELTPSWDYHHVDVEAVLAGKLGLPPPWKGSRLMDAAGLKLPQGEAAHTALGDARWHRDAYLAAYPEQQAPLLQPTTSGAA